MVEQRRKQTIQIEVWLSEEQPDFNIHKLLDENPESIAYIDDGDFSIVQRGSRTCY